MTSQTNVLLGNSFHVKIQRTRRIPWSGETVIVTDKLNEVDGSVLGSVLEELRARHSHDPNYQILMVGLNRPRAA